MILSMGATLREAMPPPMRSAKLLRLCIIMVSLIHSYTDRACGGGGGATLGWGARITIDVALTSTVKPVLMATCIQRPLCDVPKESV